LNDLHQFPHGVFVVACIAFLLSAGLTIILSVVFISPEERERIRLEARERRRMREMPRHLRPEPRLAKEQADLVSLFVSSCVRPR
jgi:hypothetical protein